ncbi:hypothetical protein ACLOJK_028728 [Asimina triloba]
MPEMGYCNGFGRRIWAVGMLSLPSFKDAAIDKEEDPAATVVLNVVGDGLRSRRYWDLGLAVVLMGCSDQPSGRCWDLDLLVIAVILAEIDLETDAAGGARRRQPWLPTIDEDDGAP